MGGPYQKQWKQTEVLCGKKMNKNITIESKIQYRAVNGPNWRTMVVYGGRGRPVSRTRGGHGETCRGFVRTATRSEAKKAKQNGWDNEATKGKSVCENKQVRTKVYIIHGWEGVVHCRVRAPGRNNGRATVVQLSGERSRSRR